MLVLGFDDQTTLDRMFALEPVAARHTILTVLREGRVDSVARYGEYGIRYVPSCTDSAELRRSLVGPAQLRPILESSGHGGLIVIDTKSDFEVLTKAAVGQDTLTVDISRSLGSEEDTGLTDFFEGSCALSRDGFLRKLGQIYVLTKTREKIVHANVVPSIAISVQLGKTVQSSA